MRIEERLEANALIERLVEDGDTFDRESARRLIALVPVQGKARPPFTFGFKAKIDGPSVTGAAAGVGDVKIPGEQRTISAETSGDEPWRIGGFKVVHRPGKLTIERMLEEMIYKAGRRCELLYGQSGPTGMMLSQPRKFGLWRFVAVIEGMAPWKTPA